MSIVNKIEYITNLYNKAYWCKRALDKPEPNFRNASRDFASKEYKSFLEEMVKNPIASKIAMRDILREHPLEYPYDASQNVKVLEKQPEIDLLIKQIESKQALQADTRVIRNDIINSERISLHSVMPKLRGVKKFIQRLKYMF